VQKAVAVLLSYFPATTRHFRVVQAKRSSATSRRILVSGAVYLRQSVLCFTAVLFVAAPASSSPQTLSLNGSGEAPVTLSSSSLSFSNQIVNTTSGAKPISLKNRLAVPLTIKSSLSRETLRKPIIVHWRHLRLQREPPAVSR